MISSPVPSPFSAPVHSMILSLPATAGILPTAEIQKGWSRTGEVRTNFCSVILWRVVTMRLTSSCRSSTSRRDWVRSKLLGSYFEKTSKNNPARCLNLPVGFFCSGVTLKDQACHPGDFTELSLVHFAQVHAVEQLLDHLFRAKQFSPILFTEFPF